MFRVVCVAVLTALSMTACVPLSTHGMKPESEILKQMQPNPALAGKIGVGNVSVDKSVSGRMNAPFSEEGFTEVLTETLQAAELLAAKQSPAYMLDAHMVENDTPVVGFSMTTPTIVEYTLKDTHGAEVYHELINLSYTAEFSDALLAEERLRMSARGSVRENLTHLVRVLNQLNLPGNQPATMQKTALPVQDGYQEPEYKAVAIPTTNNAGWGQR